MIIKRKLYAELKAQPFVYVDPEQEKRSAQERKGEALGTAILGSGGSLIAAKYGGNLIKNNAVGKESEKARKAYMSGARKLANERNAANKTAADRMTGYKDAVSKKWFGKGRAMKKAEEAYNQAVAQNESAYKTAMDKLKKEVVSKKNRAITRKGKLGKAGILLGGLGLTTVVAKSKLNKKD